jgi:hypothetical protein
MKIGNIEIIKKINYIHIEISEDKMGAKSRYIEWKRITEEAAEELERQRTIARSQSKKFNKKMKLG